jgi:hypothetical protein
MSRSTPAFSNATSLSRIAAGPPIIRCQRCSLVLETFAPQTVTGASAGSSYCYCYYCSSICAGGPIAGQSCTSDSGCPGSYCEVDANGGAIYIEDGTAPCHACIQWMIHDSAFDTNAASGHASLRWARVRHALAAHAGSATPAAAGRSGSVCAFAFV